jgi:RimJ/RimL family protein N-acetyltransferase
LRAPATGARARFEETDLTDLRPLPPSFDATTPLSGGGLRLTPLAATDLPALTEAAADPGIWAGHPARERHRAEIFLPYAESLLAGGGALVVRDGTGAVIGLSRYYASSDAPGGIGIGFTFLIRAHWGGETNFALKRVMLTHLYGSAEAAWFHIGPTNLRSQAATAKLGAERMETRMLDLGTGPAEWVRMRLTREKWAETCADRDRAA